jgi:hypothetical protein
MDVGRRAKAGHSLAEDTNPVLDEREYGTKPAAAPQRD